MIIRKADVLKEVIVRYGLVCNTFVEVTMRLSGFSDFPLTGLAYAPKTEKYKAKEKAAKEKKADASLLWHERMADWASESRGAVLYDDSKKDNQTLPVPQAGDIVVLGFAMDQSEGLHANLVVSDGAGFNLAGAHSTGRKSSASALSSSFQKYDQEFPGKFKTLPEVMKKKEGAKYLLIMRPNYAQPKKAPSDMDR